MSKPTEKDIDNALSDLVAHAVVAIRTQEPGITVPLFISLTDHETSQRLLLAAVHMLALYVERDHRASIPTN